MAALSQRTRILGVGALAVLAAQFAWVAWVHDDAYITFRTVDNFVHGYGLRWNTIERVQTYTHPLWMLLHVPFYAVTREAFLTTLAISLSCSVAAVAIPLFPALDRPWLALGALAAPFGLATAVVQYTSSGLETPLTFLLLSVFFVLLMRADAAAPPLTALSIVSALGMLNRLDAMLLYAPILGWLAVRYRSHGSVRKLLIGASAIAVWELFSLFYYGFPFPNTFYAKQPVGFSRPTIVHAGLIYAWDMVLRRQGSALLFVAAVGAVGLLHHRRRGAGHPSDPRLLLLAGGALLYGLYTVWIGGDYLSARFWAAPVFLAILLWHHALRQLVPPRQDAAVAIACATVLALLRVAGPVRAHDALFSRAGITHTSSYLEGKDLLRNYSKANNVAHFRLAIGGRVERERADAMQAAGASERHVIRNGTIGLAGYYGGPNLVMVDPLGLGDPLIARLPVSDPMAWRSGHLEREVPVGYEETLRTGDTTFLPPALRTYYERLRTVIAGPLWSVDRIVSVLAFNTGQYDGLLADYVSPDPAGALALAELAEPIPAGTPVDDERLVRIASRTQVVVHADPPVVGSELEIGLESFGRYLVMFYSGDDALGRLMLRPGDSMRTEHVVLTRTVALPESVRGRPVTTITIEPRGGFRPQGGNGVYRLGHLSVR